LAIEILDIHTQGGGWTAILPGLGLLPDDFPDAYLRVFDLSDGDFAYLREDVAIEQHATRPQPSLVEGVEEPRPLRLGTVDEDLRLVSYEQLCASAESLGLRGLRGNCQVGGQVGGLAQRVFRSWPRRRSMFTCHRSTRFRSRARLARPA
jgi:hypothetical protein